MSRTSPGKDVRPIHGRYWESLHFTKKYTVYLELMAPPLWIDKYVVQNKLTKFSEVIIPVDAPAWFKVPKKFIAWKHAQDEQSIYFEDIETARSYIYEDQL